MAKDIPRPWAGNILFQAVLFICGKGIRIEWYIFLQKVVKKTAQVVRIVRRTQKR
ncbi:hypothetical protein HUG15_14025 [Salicibibacter cibarius]|uniref:Uncharacterized protein n=1 Tax=Salicibibacter cibarius TaxID=2743000 RepID=A0A7T6Z456_9BACI|nr:hypothetical protein [Salicibibacter cibarius]QQK76569.1 hypothetical protein HUG15_14025 [Salicibibacter cibarius]